MSLHDPEMSKALQPWDGTWFIPLPKPGLRLMGIHQFTAKQLLAYHSELTNWEAHLCQIIFAQDDPPSSIQEHYLKKIAARVGGRIAA